MQGINKVILIGNIGKAPELKTLADGTPVAKMHLATTELHRGKDGRQVANTQWHTIILWRGLAKLAGEYLQKGSHVYIEGRLNHRQYTDTKGENRRVTEVFAERLLMLDKKEKGQEEYPATDEILPF